MHLRSIAIYFFAIVFLLSARQLHAQNNSWFKTQWHGVAYLMDKDPDQNYELSVNIQTMKGDKFEGTMKVMQSFDTSVQFNTKVSGIINRDYVLFNIDNWKVKCSNCKPKSLSYTIESDKFFFKGDARGCSQECTWVIEIFKDLIDFDKKDLSSLYALVPAADTALEEPPVAVIENPIAPLPDTAVATLVEKPVVIQRIAILPAGDIVAKPKTTSQFVVKNPSVLPSKKLTYQIPETVSVLNRTPTIAAGDIIQSEKDTSSLALKVPAGNVSKSSLQTIPQAISVLNRTPLLPAGEIIGTPKDISALSVKSPAGAIKYTSLLVIPATVSTLHRLPSAPAADIAIGNRDTSSLIAKNKTSGLNAAPPVALKEIIPETKKIPVTIDTIAVSVKKEPAPVAEKKLPDVPNKTVSNLPDGYAERKKNVVRNIMVNTDSITLRLYDNGVVDGDIVSVVFNDIVVIDRLSLTSKAMVLKIPVNKLMVNKLVFHAHNLGEFPPNTAKLEVLYGNKKEELTISSDYTVSSAIDITYGQ